MSSAEELHDGPVGHDHKDSFLYMMLRREINEVYAEQPVDFNVEGLRAGERFLGRPYTPADSLLDVGSSTGKMVADAVDATGANVRITCLEPDPEALQAFSLLPENKRAGLSIVKGIAEDMPLPDDRFAGATLHNVIFRAGDAGQMLQEVKRVVQPGGFIAISTNRQGHAYYRHEFERAIAEQVREVTEVEFTIPLPPAEGHYLEDLPQLIRTVGDLDPVDELQLLQDSRAIISPGERLDTYLQSLDYSAANVKLPLIHRPLWRSVVHTSVQASIMDMMDKHPPYHWPDGTETPFFADAVYRGMMVLRNNKSTVNTGSP